MISGPPIYCEIALILGGSGFLAKLALRPRSIPELIAKIDIKLASKLHKCHEDYSQGMIHDGRAVLAAIGGVRGIPHLIGQARLLVSIIFEMRKQYPGCFEAESERVRGAIAAITMAALLSAWEHLRSRSHPHMTRIATFLCAEAFVHLSAEVESAMGPYESLMAGSISL